MPNYIVTGANGQLARCFKALHSNFPRINLHFANEEDLDITNRHNLLAFFTLTNGVNNFFELGDILKVKFKLHRNLFSKALNLACKEAITMFGKDGVFCYPCERRNGL